MLRWLLIGVAIVAAVAAYVIVTAPPMPNVGRATQTAQVIRVIDGDTVILADGRKVRYLGIDAPEISHTPLDPYSPEAFELNRKLVQAKDVRLEYDVNKTDSYGRTLAFVYVEKNGRWVCVNAELVRAGLARTLFVPPNSKYKRYFRKLEAEAFAARRGIWSGVTAHPPVLTAAQTETEFNNYQWKWVTVRFTVADVYQSAAIVALHSAADYKGHFTAVIFTGDLDRFTAHGIDPATDYYGKTLAVTGYLKDYHGPEIIVQSPQQITVVTPVPQTSSNTVFRPAFAGGV